MIRKQKLFLTLLFIIMGLFTAIQNSAADEWIPEPNWWFKQEYTIDGTALPENLFFITTRYEETALGELVFRNGGDTPVFLLDRGPIPTTEFRTGSRLSEEFIREHSTLLEERRATTVRASIFLDAHRFNRDGEGEITQEPPPPYKTRMVMFVDRVVHVVPVTVTYHINPTYDPVIDPPPPTLAKLAISAAAVVEGTLQLSEDQESGDTYIYQGIAEMSVRRWYKGEGPALIQVNFGMWNGEFTNPSAAENVILFLEAPPAGVETVHLVSGDAYRYIAWTEPYQNHIEEIVAAVGHDPISPPIMDRVSTTIETTAVSKPTVLWLGLGVAGLVLAAVIALFLIRRRRRLA